MVRIPVLYPHCHSDQVLKGGKTKTGQQRYKPMVLVAYKLCVYIELYKLTIHIFELAIILPLFHPVSVPSFPSQESRMTTWDLIIALFYHVDEQLHDIPKPPEAHLWPSEVVTLGLLHALKGVGNRAFHRWLTRDYRPLFPRLPSAPGSSVSSRRIRTGRGPSWLLQPCSG
jgi:hypothetical protein